MVRSLMLVSALGVSFAAQEQADFSRPAIEARVKALRPDVEAALRTRFDPPPRFKVVEQYEVTDLLARENTELLSQIEGGLRGRALRRACRREARALTRSIFAKTELKTGVIHVHPHGFRTMAALGDGRFRGMLRPGFLDFILVHELVHVFQQQTFGLWRFMGKPRSEEELRARLCVVEGHAQYVARRVCEKRKLLDSYELLRTLFTSGADSVKDPAARLLLQVANVRQGFAYMSGEKFVRAVVKALGEQAAVKRLFADPPRRFRQVSHPDEYLAPTGPGVDLAGVARTVATLLDAERYRPRVTSLSEATLRAAFRPIEPRTIDAALKGLRQVVAVVAPRKKGRRGQQLVVAVMECESPAAARTIMALEKELLHKKDARFKKPGGLVQIVSTRYEKSGLEGVEGVYARKQIRQRGLRELYAVQTLVLVHADFVVEISATMLAETGATLRALGRRVLEVLKTS